MNRGCQGPVSLFDLEPFFAFFAGLFTARDHRGDAPWGVVLERWNDSAAVAFCTLGEEPQCIAVTSPTMVTSLPASIW